MNGGPSIVRRPSTEKSNTELTNSLRANFVASKAALGREPNKSANRTINGNTCVNDATSHLETWTSRKGDTIYVPTIDFSTSGLIEERPQYDITVKLFFLPSTKIAGRSSYTKEAISLVLQELHVPSIDLLIVSFQGVSFDADDDEDEDLDDDQEAMNQLREMVKTWQTLEQLHSKGVVAQIGLAEFGSERLKRFLPNTKVRPSVDQINVRDCCVVPKSLILYAKKEHIELLTHNDCTNILPKGTIRELLGSGEKGVHLLSNVDVGTDGLKGEIEPQWVVKYTAVVRDRGVIENKGYFAMAEVEA
ncbi:hypothetical protein MMC19_004398 [Ptychographa xylographoides]|nr:hypothetical protein [Ptychographa xylographoides]